MSVVGSWSLVQVFELMHWFSLTSPPLGALTVIMQWHLFEPSLRRKYLALCDLQLSLQNLTLSVSLEGIFMVLVPSNS